MTGDIRLSDAGGTVAVVDAPIKTGKDGGVDASNPSVVAARVVFRAVVLGAVGRDAAEDFDVRFHWKDGKGERNARAEEGAVHIAGEVSAGVAGERDGAKMSEAVVETEGSGKSPGFLIDLGFFASGSTVDAEFGLGVEGRSDEAEQEEGEDSAAHA